jgi:hypothetical protein
MAMPKTDSELVSWSTNFDAKINASAVTYQLQTSQCTAYTALHDPFVAAYNAVVAAREAGTRSSTLCATKDSAKLDLLRYGRELYAYIQNAYGISDAAKINAGVHVRAAEPTPQPVPNFAPELTVISINGRLVSVRLADPAYPTRKRMPDGVDGATLMSFVGEEAPSDPTLYKYEGSVSKTTAEILFPETATPGTNVWICAFFFNERKQNGPACNPVPAKINYAASMPMAA